MRNRPPAAAQQAESTGGTLALATNVTYVTTPSGKIHITYKVITKTKMNITVGNKQYLLYVVGMVKGQLDNATNLKMKIGYELEQSLTKLNKTLTAEDVYEIKIITRDLNKTADVLTALS